jgi:hypothetical protein
VVRRRFALDELLRDAGGKDPVEAVYMQMVAGVRLGGGGGAG